LDTKVQLPVPYDIFRDNIDEGSIGSIGFFGFVGFKLMTPKESPHFLNAGIARGPIVSIVGGSELSSPSNIFQLPVIETRNVVNALKKGSIQTISLLSALRAINISNQIGPDMACLSI
jgi:hypothetical protein